MLARRGAHDASSDGNMVGNSALDVKREVLQMMLQRNAGSELLPLDPPLNRGPEPLHSRPCNDDSHPSNSTNTSEETQLMGHALHNGDVSHVVDPLFPHDEGGGNKPKGSHALESAATTSGAQVVPAAQGFPSAPSDEKDASAKNGQGDAGRQQANKRTLDIIAQVLEAMGQRCNVPQSPPCEPKAEGLLLERHFAVFHNVLDKRTIEVARREALDHLAELGRDGRIGGSPEGGSAVPDINARGDRVCWLTKTEIESGGRSALLAVIRMLLRLRKSLAEAGHDVGGAPAFQLACYPKNGARFVRHSDKSESAPNRMITAICYLNYQWDCKRDGGQLCLYPGSVASCLARDAGRESQPGGIYKGEEATFMVAPVGGRLVVFRSDIEHEVLPAFSERVAVTAWFYADPARQRDPTEQRQAVPDEARAHELDAAIGSTVPSMGQAPRPGETHADAPAPVQHAESPMLQLPHLAQSADEPAAEPAPVAKPAQLAKPVALPANVAELILNLAKPAPAAKPAPNQAHTPLPAQAQVKDQASRESEVGPLPRQSGSLVQKNACTCLDVERGRGRTGLDPAPAYGSACGSAGHAGTVALSEQIFVSVAAYRDPETCSTVKNLFEQADRPETLRIGIVWQIDPTEDAEFANLAPIKSTWLAQVREIRVHWSEATGPCKARALAQGLWAGEGFFLQIDSHMRFCPGWDTALRAHLAAAEAGSTHGKAVLSCYPPAYEAETSKEDSSTAGERPTLLCASGFGEDGMLRIGGRSFTPARVHGAVPLYSSSNKSECTLRPPTDPALDSSTTLLDGCGSDRTEGRNLPRENPILDLTTAPADGSSAGRTNGRSPSGPTKLERETTMAPPGTSADSHRRAELCGSCVVPSLFWAAGFSFSRSSFITEVPYDPQLPFLFFGEEMGMLVRMWTCGWDVFAPGAVLAFHRWSRAYRRTFYQDIKQDVQAKQASQDKIRALLGGPPRRSQQVLPATTPCTGLSNPQDATDDGVTSHGSGAAVGSPVQGGFLEEGEGHIKGMVQGGCLKEGEGHTKGRESVGQGVEDGGEGAGSPEDEGRAEGKGTLQSGGELRGEGALSRENAEQIEGRSLSRNGQGDHGEVAGVPGEGGGCLAGTGVMKAGAIGRGSGALGKYGLGNMRSLDAFYSFTGVDFRTGKVTDKAVRGGLPDEAAFQDIRSALPDLLQPIMKKLGTLSADSKS